MLQELEGFTFATALDLNQVWATKPLDWILTCPESRICTINFPWGKYSYKWLPMDTADSPDIFKAKMSELMRALEFVSRQLINYYQVTKASLSDHLDNLKRYSQGCEKQALNNAAKSKILYPVTGYLEHILTRDELNYNLIRLRLTRNTSSCKWDEVKCLHLLPMQLGGWSDQGNYS